MPGLVTESEPNPTRPSTTTGLARTQLPAWPIGVLLASVQPRRQRVNLAFVGGSVPAIQCLGHAARHEAARLGMESAGGMLRRTQGVVEGLELAGYELRDEHVMIVYERPVP